MTLYLTMKFNTEPFIGCQYEDVMTSDYDWFGSIFDQIEEAYFDKKVYRDSVENLEEFDDEDIYDKRDLAQALVMYLEDRIDLIKQNFNLHED